MFDTIGESTASQSSSTMFDTIGASTASQSSSTMTDTIEDQLVPSTGPNYSMAITELRERAISYNYSHIINVIRERATSPNYAFEITTLLEGLIRSPQIAQNTLDAELLVNAPVQVLSSLSNVNMTTTQVSSLFLVPTGKIVIILGILFEATTANTVTVVPTMSLGIATGENDIFATESLVSFDTVGDTWSNWLVFSSSRAGIAGEEIKMNIAGATATSLVADIHLIGFLV